MIYGNFLHALHVRVANVLALAFADLLTPTPLGGGGRRP